MIRSELNAIGSGGFIVFMYNKDQNSTQYALENIRTFNIPPTCFGQAGPSLGRTCKIQSRNCGSLPL